MTCIREVVLNLNFSQLIVLKSYGIQKEYCKIEFVDKPAAMEFMTGITVNPIILNIVAEIKNGKLCVNNWIYSLENPRNYVGNACENTKELKNISCYYFERSFIRTHNISDFKVVQANDEFCILVNGYFLIYANRNYYECWETCFNLLSVIKTNKFYFLTKTEVLYVLENQEMKFIDKNISGILKKKSRCAGIKFADTGSLVNIYKYKNLQPRKWYFNNKIYTGFSMCLYHSLKKKLQDKLLLIYWILFQELPQEIVLLLMKKIIVKYRLTQ